MNASPINTVVRNGRKSSCGDFTKLTSTKTEKAMVTAGNAETFRMGNAASDSKASEFFFFIRKRKNKIRNR